jgi:hypothetical protein
MDKDLVMTFKIGDIVRFNQGEDAANEFPGDLIVTYLLKRSDDGGYMVYFKRPENTRASGGYYDYRFYLVGERSPIDKHQAVIDKIKYLNTRYEQRKTCHV